MSAETGHAEDRVAGLLTGVRVTVIGGEGFVGSAFDRAFRRAGAAELITVTRSNYRQLSGHNSDIVVECACNSKKFLAAENPLLDFDLSVSHRLRTLIDFPATLQVHISSVDVYANLESPERTLEDGGPVGGAVSTYGFHKRLAEDVVRHYAPEWLIFRLAGMVGAGLRKNPVFDILHDRPIFIHPESQYQYMNTDDVAESAIWFIANGYRREIINVCGDGLISPRAIAAMAGKPLRVSEEAQVSEPRIVNINIEKFKKCTSVPSTRDSVAHFLRGEPS